MAEEHSSSEEALPPQDSLQMSIPAEAVGAEEEMEDELLVLDPDHPLMRRFQSVLKSHLEKQLEDVNTDMRENRVMERAEGKSREELGVEVYSVQHELARLQTNLDNQHDADVQMAAQRHQAQEQLEAVRSQYQATVNQTRQQRTCETQLQTEVDNLVLRLFYMQGVNRDLQSDISVVKNASSKAQTEKARAAEEKNAQDLYVERLTKQVERLTEQIGLYKAQTDEQSAESQVAKEALAEAQMEMDSVLVEQKQLLQHWNSSLFGMRRRDEAYAAMQEALSTVRNQVRTLDTEIDCFKKSIAGEEERNERLTMLLNRSQLDCETSRKLMAQSQTKQEVLQTQYSTYTRMLQESEQMLGRVTGDCAARQGELHTLRKEMEKEASVRQELENKTMTKMHEHLTHDQGAKYSRRLMEEMAAHRTDRDLQLSQLENEVAQVMLGSTEVTLHLESLRRVLAELGKQIDLKHKQMSDNEAEMKRQMTVMERKQDAISICNKKIEQIRAETGHKDLSVLEIRMNKLSKELEEVGTEMKEQQQHWLRQQEELVRLNQERQAQGGDVLALQTQLTILQQKKLRREGEIQQENQELAEVERNMKNLMLDLVKLNNLVNKNSQQHEALEQSNSLMENDFLQRLKEAERESIKIQMKHEDIQEEKERLLSFLVETERQIMLWEKKTQLAKESRMAVDSEIGQGDIRSMKAEIHRMEVRYGQLMKQQGRLLNEMEAMVARRGTIETQAKAQARADRRQPTHTDFRSVLQGLRRKIQDTQKQVKESEGVVAELQEAQQSLSSSLREKQQHLDELQSASAVRTADLRSLQDSKERNLTRLIALQARAKQLQVVREGRYTFISVSESALEPAKQRLEERLHTVSTILHRVCQESPHHEGALRHLSLTLANRLENQQETA
ncbi:coiled-coil domain-containing protein 40 [Conger conger]|uniref:coiled-coil domain-containing protein 40 n=1 Tax=Conger conger TaxID=82655 RepID=UPI002A5AE21D|nr:coiled-coil domain-containing protein 40 [Conger conger]